MACLGINSRIIDDINLVIFDKDGTLMNLYMYWSRMVAIRVDLAQQRLGFSEESKREIMYAMGVDLENGKLRREGPVGLKKREIVMQAMIDALDNIGFKDTHDLCFEIFREADELSFKHLHEIIKPVNGLQVLIDALHERGCKIAVATTDKSERAGLALEYLGIIDKVDAVIGADMVQHCKPAPDMVDMIIDQTGIRREQAVVVGDALTDVEMGINAGLKASIGVCSGLTKRESLMKVTNYVVDDISEIKILEGK